MEEWPWEISPLTAEGWISVIFMPVRPMYVHLGFASARLPYLKGGIKAAARSQLMFPATCDPYYAPTGMALEPMTCACCELNTISGNIAKTGS
jgi:hypothetical protein